jgi:protein SCO1/2
MTDRLTSRTPVPRALFGAASGFVCAAMLALSAYAGLPPLENPKDDTRPAAEQPRLPGRVAIAQKLNTQLPMNLMFRDEYGNVVRFGDYFKSGRPVLLTFMYFRCPMLCSMVLEGTTTAMTELKYDIGKEFDVVTVSIDPRDKPAIAMQMKEKYVKRYGRLSAANGWHFLTSNDDSIHKLTEAAGFQYAYDPETDQFAHGAAILILTPQGKVSRYFYGFEYKPRDLRLALSEASQNKIGGIAEQILLLCFHYDPATGKYSQNAMTFVRASGVATVLSLAGFVFIMLRRERRHALHHDEKSASGPVDDGPEAR